MKALRNLEAAVFSLLAWGWAAGLPPSYAPKNFDSLPWSTEGTGLPGARGGWARAAAEGAAKGGAEGRAPFGLQAEAGDGLPAPFIEPGEPRPFAKTPRPGPDCRGSE